MASRRPLIINSAANQIQELTDSDSLIGNGTVPIGGIIMWSGTIAEIANISGWELCDGNNGTPDLRDRFVIGATTDGSDGTFPGLSVDQSGGSADAVVVSHSHTITDPGHNHTTSTDLEDPNSSGITQGPGNRNHGVISSNSTILNANTTGIEIDTEGVSGINANLPPWYALAFIMRTV